MVVAVPADPELTLRPLRRAEYDLLVEAGALAGEPVELLEGALVRVSPQGGRHARTVARLVRLLNRELPGGWEVRPALPYLADDLSEPEPDVAVVPWRDDDRHPDAAVLVVEVSRTSLVADLGVKARTCARSGVPEYWVVDLVTDVVHVHTGPRGCGWDSVVQQPFATPLTALGVRVVVADLLR